MVCESDADVDIQIPAVMLPQDAGSNLEKYINNNTMGMAFFLSHFFNINVTVDPVSFLFLKNTFLIFLLLGNTLSSIISEWILICLHFSSLFSFCCALLSKAPSSWCCRSVFVANGRWYHFVCFLLVCMDCQRSCYWARQVTKGQFLSF